MRIEWRGLVIGIAASTAMAVGLVLFPGRLVLWVVLALSLGVTAGSAIAGLLRRWPSAFFGIAVTAAVLLAWPLYSRWTRIDEMGLAGSDSPLPGVTVLSELALQDEPATQRQYVYSIANHDGAHADLFVSSTNRLTFSVYDVHGEPYSLEIPFGPKDFPIGRDVVIICEAGSTSNASFMRASADGHVVAYRNYPFPLDLGSRNWQGVVLGPPIVGAISGTYLMKNIVAWSQTFPIADEGKLVDGARNMSRKK